MDPGGSQPDPGLSQRGTPCLIVADSQPESVGPEEDAEQACLGVLARRLPVRRSPSPVLEIVRSPAGSRAPAGGEADRERPAGESGARGRAVLAEPMESPARPDAAGPRSRVAEEVPPPGGESSAPVKTEERAGSDVEDCPTSPCVEDTGMSQLPFGALELSQSQDFESDFVPNEDARHQFHSGAAIPSSSRPSKSDSKDELNVHNRQIVSGIETHAALESQPEESERALQEGEEGTTKEMPVSDPLKSEKSVGICHEELDILSTQEEMFPENNVTGNG